MKKSKMILLVLALFASTVLFQSCVTSNVACPKWTDAKLNNSQQNGVASNKLVYTNPCQP